MSIALTSFTTVGYCCLEECDLLLSGAEARMNWRWKIACLGLCPSSSELLLSIFIG